MEELVREYFVRPIIERTGYNAINTLTYALLALAALYVIWRLLRGRGFDFSGKEFLFGVGAFVLLGSTARVLTDLSDSGAMALAAGSGGPLGAVYSAVYSSGIFTYGYLTVTPGIYVVTAALFLAALAAGMAMGRKMFAACAGLALWLPCFLLLVPFMKNFDFALLAAALAALASSAAIFLLRRVVKRKAGIHEILAVAGQALDGAATFVVLDIFSAQTGKGYFEQHVLSAGIGTATPLGFGLFFLVKVALAVAIVHFLGKEEMDAKDKALVLVVVAIMGFAPGLRDLLRMLVGS